MFMLTSIEAPLSDQAESFGSVAQLALGVLSCCRFPKSSRNQLRAPCLPGKPLWTNQMASDLQPKRRQGFFGRVENIPLLDLQTADPARKATSDCNAVIDRFRHADKTGGLIGRATKIPRFKLLAQHYALLLVRMAQHPRRDDKTISRLLTNRQVLQRQRSRK